MKFVQIVEFNTSKIDEMRARGTQYEQETEGRRPPGKGILAADRDNPGRYMVIADFPSYEEAMKNSEAPETQKMAEDMQNLSDGPPKFYNLDVLEVWGD